MNLRAVDLNLLAVLDALLDEAHVSRAAERIGMSQPAASNALERCRALFADPLLERAGGAMRLTPKAQALRAPLKQALADIARIVRPDDIDLAQLRQSVRLIMADQPAQDLLADLHRTLAASAPSLTLVLQPWFGASDALQRLSRGEADLAASVFPALGEEFRRRPLLHEQYRVVMRRDHPAASGFDLARWLAFPHVLVSSRGETVGALDQALHALGRSRTVGVVVPGFLLVPPLLARSDLIALLPSRCLPAAARGMSATFATFDPPIPVEGFTLHLAWHRRRDEDVGVRWVARLIEQHFQAGDE